MIRLIEAVVSVGEHHITVLTAVADLPTREVVD